MSQALAIIYKHYYATFKEDELKKYLDFFNNHPISAHYVKKENGSIELTLSENEFNTIHVHIEKIESLFIINQTFRLQESLLTEIMRESVSLFKMDTVIEHVYKEFDMVCRYRKGIMDQIKEKNERNEKIIYDFDTIYSDNQNRIEKIKEEINYLLDKRNQIEKLNEVKEIDERLKKLTKQIKTATI